MPEQRRLGDAGGIVSFSCPTTHLSQATLSTAHMSGASTHLPSSLVTCQVSVTSSGHKASLFTRTQPSLLPAFMSASSLTNQCPTRTGSGSPSSRAPPSVEDAAGDTVEEGDLPGDRISARCREADELREPREPRDPREDCDRSEPLVDPCSEAPAVRLPRRFLRLACTE